MSTGLITTSELPDFFEEFHNSNSELTFVEWLPSVLVRPLHSSEIQMIIDWAVLRFGSY